MVADVPVGDWRGPRHHLPTDMATDSTRRLHHTVPPWVASDAVYHIRIRTAIGSGFNLTAPDRASALLDSARQYHLRDSWHSHLFLLMPDHIHALLCFPPEDTRTKIVGKWKAWHCRHTGILWQDNFFDHRIRNAGEYEMKAACIRQNPVVKGLCQTAEDWPWVLEP
ncbi:MAG: transposase [Tepidisphaerales bacterium]